MKRFIPLLVFGFLATPTFAQPNLVPNPGVESLGVYIKTVKFSASDWVVQTGQVSAGKHKVLTFSAGVYNTGTADLTLGNPPAAGFIFDQPNAVYRYLDFVRFDLLDSHGHSVAGLDYAMCVQDFSVIPGGPSVASDGFTCGHEGITAGWRAFSVVDNGIGPFVVIDSVPSGTYTLRQTVNPTGSLTETSYADNSYQFSVRIK